MYTVHTQYVKPTVYLYTLYIVNTMYMAQYNNSQVLSELCENKFQFVNMKCKMPAWLFFINLCKPEVLIQIFHCWQVFSLHLYSG